MPQFVKPDDLDNEQVVEIKIRATSREFGILIRTLEYLQRTDAVSQQLNRLAEWTQLPLGDFRKSTYSLFQRVADEFSKYLKLKPSTRDEERETGINQQTESRTILAAIDYVASSVAPHSNRWELAQALNISARDGDQLVKNLLDMRIIKVGIKDGLAQLEINKSTETIDYISYLIENTGLDEPDYGKNTYYLDELFKLYKPLKRKEIIETIEDFDEGKLNLLSHYLRALLSEEIQTPREAPELYQGKEISGEIVPFLNRVYAPYMDGIAFGRKELSELDPKAHSALNGFEHRYGKVPLTELNLPTLAQKNDLLVAGITPRQMTAAHTVGKSARGRQRHLDILDLK